MKRKYELWLDESGKFSDETKLDPDFNSPSMVGGLLITEENAKKLAEKNYRGILDNEKNHANKMTPYEKREYVLPCLEKIKKDYGAVQVFFENSEYEDEDTNRQLYLRVIAEGILQLMQTLNAEHESIELNVIIAQRQDITASPNHRRISEEEYIRTINRFIEVKEKEHRIFLQNDCKLSFKIRVATKEKKLYFADFACNTRFIRKSKTFHSVIDRVNLLYDNAYIFHLSEMSSVNYIRKSLIQGNISDAVMELYTSHDELNHEKELELIFKRMLKTDYRLVKSQLKQFEREIISYTAKEDDYEISERILSEINTELIPKLKENNFPVEKIHFILLLQLTDMFLREGDIKNSEIIINECRAAQELLDGSIENLLTYYQLIEKEELVKINQCDYEGAGEIMHSISKSFVAIMNSVKNDSNLKIRFPEIKSEYYGDSLCMEIYAKMFLQRSNPSLYEELCTLSDIALNQYPGYEGELERHRQYRSHIEMENGNYEIALLWLINAKKYRKTCVTEEIIMDFLQSVCDSEFEMSCQYYLMYYLLIMCEASLSESPLADIMEKCLIEQNGLFEIGELWK